MNNCQLHKQNHQTHSDNAPVCIISVIIHLKRSTRGCKFLVKHIRTFGHNKPHWVTTDGNSCHCAAESDGATANVSAENYSLPLGEEARKGVGEDGFSRSKGEEMWTLATLSCAPIAVWWVQMHVQYNTLCITLHMLLDLCIDWLEREKGQLLYKELKKRQCVHTSHNLISRPKHF